MDKAMVKKISDFSLSGVGKFFTGYYAQSSQYVNDIQTIMSKMGTRFITNKILNVYYDNPKRTKTEDLKCFQDVFLENDSDSYAPSLSKIHLNGNFLYTKVSGDLSKII